MNLEELAALARKGSRLGSEEQWQLADALATISNERIAEVAVLSDRNESTLLQYKRAAERWHPADRVDGVSFSAHRTVLSWHLPRELLIELKAKHGSPTVRQVREAMGLEGHPILEHIRKAQHAAGAGGSPPYAEIRKAIDTLSNTLDIMKAADNLAQLEQEAQVHTEADSESDPITPVEGTRWVPPISTSDLVG